MMRIEDMILNEYIVYCHYRNEYIRLMELLDSKGFLWSSGINLTGKDSERIEVFMAFPVYIFIHQNMENKNNYITYGSLCEFDSIMEQVDGRIVYDVNDFVGNKK